MGLLDADGTVNFYPHSVNKVVYRNQLTITVFQKYYINVLAFQNKFGGHIYYDKSGTGGYY